MQWELPYSYEIIFNNVDSTERPVKLTSPQSKTTLEGLVITPRELYSMVSVNILALTPFPWKRYSAVEVHTRYKDEANGIHLNDTFLLKDQQAEHTWKMFVINPQLKRFEYKLVYRAVNNKDITMSWVVTDEEQVIVRDPYPMKRTLKVVPSFNWEDVDRAFVDLTYEDKANQILESESFEFSAGDNATKTFSVDLRNVDLRLVAYQLIVLFKDGITYEVPRSFTNANRIILHKNLRGHRIVTVRPDVVNFAKRKAKRLKVEIRYEDAMNDLSFSDSFSFDEKTLNGVGYFEYDFVEKPHYEYRVWVWFQSGTPRVSEWLKSNVDELLVPVS